MQTDSLEGKVKRSIPKDNSLPTKSTLSQRKMRKNVTPGGTVSIDSLLARARILQETANGKAALDMRWHESIHVDTWYTIYAAFFGRTWNFAFHAALSNPRSPSRHVGLWEVKLLQVNLIKWASGRSNQAEAQGVQTQCLNQNIKTSLHLVAFAEWILGFSAIWPGPFATSNPPACTVFSPKNCCS